MRRAVPPPDATGTGSSGAAARARRPVAVLVRWLAGFVAAGVVVGSPLWVLFDGSWISWFLWAGVLAAVSNVLRWVTEGRRGSASGESGPVRQGAGAARPGD